MVNLVQRMAARALGLATADDVRQILKEASIGRDDYNPLSEPGYRLVTSLGSPVANPVALQKIQREAQDMSLTDPLIMQAVRIKRIFVLGAGITFKAEDPEIDKLLHAFWADELEKMPEQLEEWFDSLVIGSELCLRFYQALDGTVRVRLIPALEITDVVTHPEDRHVIEWVRRQYTVRVFNSESKLWSEHARDEWIPGEEILWLAVNKLPGWVRGVSQLYVAIPWARAYAEWLRDRMSINKSRGAWAWIRRVKGGLGAVAAAAGRLASDIGGAVKSAATAPEPTKAPPKPGSVITANEGVEWSTVNNKVDADNAKEDGRAIKLQVAAAVNVFEHYFGDASVANLASAKAMELPMLKEYEWWRAKLGWVLGQVFHRLLRAKVAAGRLSEEYQVLRQIVQDNDLVDETVTKATVDCPVDINWPALRIEDRKPTTEAAKLEQEMGVKSDATLASELGVEDWPQEQARLLQEKRARQAEERAQVSDDYPPFPGAPDDDDPGGDDSGGDGGGGGPAPGGKDGPPAGQTRPAAGKGTRGGAPKGAK